MRKLLAVSVGFVLAAAGASFVYSLLFVAESVSLHLLLGASGTTTIGCYMIWETITDPEKS